MVNSSFLREGLLRAGGVNNKILSGEEVFSFGAIDTRFGVTNPEVREVKDVLDVEGGMIEPLVSTADAYPISVY